jgi:hypothetical protein
MLLRKRKKKVPVIGGVIMANDVLAEMIGIRIPLREKIYRRVRLFFWKLRWRITTLF